MMRSSSKENTTIRYHKKSGIGFAAKQKIGPILMVKRTENGDPQIDVEWEKVLEFETLIQDGRIVH